ncbi:kinetochore binding, partial [Pristimantis euphronides]
MDESGDLLKLLPKEVEEERDRAAKYRLQLLESQSDHQKQLEEQRYEMTGTIENLEQEKYLLRREVELKNSMLQSLSSECENIKQQQTACVEQIKEKLERARNRAMSKLKEQMEALKAELDEARLSEQQLKHKLDRQAELLVNKSKELHLMSERANKIMPSEILTLQLAVKELEGEKAELGKKINELRYYTQELVFTTENQSRRLECLHSEKEEREKEAIDYSSALKQSRVANQELKMQLDSALQEAQDPKSKGNSLFAEVDDRRIEVEQKLNSMKVQYQSLQKQHVFSREQMHRMKVQVSTLLQLKGVQCDPEQMERLQSMIAQKNREVEELLRKLHHLEKCQ